MDHNSLKKIIISAWALLIWSTAAQRKTLQISVSAKWFAVQHATALLESFISFFFGICYCPMYVTTKAFLTLNDE